MKAISELIEISFFFSFLFFPIRDPRDKYSVKCGNTRCRTRCLLWNFYVAYQSFFPFWTERIRKRKCVKKKRQIKGITLSGMAYSLETFQRKRRGFDRNLSASRSGATGSLHQSERNSRKTRKGSVGGGTGVEGGGGKDGEGGEWREAPARSFEFSTTTRAY